MRFNALSVAVVLGIGICHAQDNNRSANADDTTTLDAIQVQAAFLNTAAKSATKMDIEVMDTPFSVQSYSRGFIDAVEASSLSELFNYMTGIKRAGLTGMDISFRGFKSSGDDLNSVLVDGLPGASGRFGSPPSIALEQVELVRGSMSVLYGQNQPGGFVNLITKKPKYDYATSIGLRATAYHGGDGRSLGLGDATGYMVDFDTTGHMDAEGHILYRIVGERTDRDTFRDHDFDESTYLVPSVTWNIGGAGSPTQITAQFEYRKSKRAFDQGLVAPNRDIRLVAPIRTFYGEPGQFRSETGKAFSLFISHMFDNGWQLNASGRTLDYESEQKEFSHVGIRADGRTLNRRARWLETERDLDNYDVNLIMDFATGAAIHHKMVAGVTGGRNRIRESRHKFFNSQCPGQFCFDIDIYDPVYGNTPDYDDIPAVNPGSEFRLTNKLGDRNSRAFYLSDLVSLGERWKISLGLRNFREGQDLFNLRNPSEPVNSKVSRKSALPMAGMLFQPDTHWTVYISYSESYVPADPSDVDINGENTFEPLSGKQYEAGIKTEELLGGRLSASLAAFRINQHNLMNSFSCTFGVCYDQLGKARSEGVELEANLWATRRWQLKLGYAYTDAKVIASNVPIQIGKSLANAPKHIANLWSSYDFENGFSLGTGITHIGDYAGVVPSASAPTLMPMPAYTLVDVTANYRIGQHSFNLKAGNIFDKQHYEATGLTGQIQIVPGPPRNLTLSWRYKF